MMCTWWARSTFTTASSEPICTCASASSIASRAAPCCTDSPFSMKPAGMVQKPWRGSIARLHIRILPSTSMTQPAMMRGFS